MDSPIGPLFVAWNGLGVSAADGVRPTFAATHEARTGRRRSPGRACPPELAGAIRRRLDGDRRVRIDLDLRGHSEFERDVWRKALEIPRGEVRPYGWIAARDRPAEGGPGGRHGPRAQPRAAHRAVPSRRPDRRDDRPVLAGRSGEQADDPRRRGPGPRRHGGAARRGERLVGSRDDAHRVLADLPDRPAHARPQPTAVPVARGRRGGRLPAVQGLPARLPRPRPDAGRLDSADQRIRSLDSTARLDLADLCQPVPTCVPPPVRAADLGRDARPLHRLGLDLPRDRGRRRHDPAVPDGGARFALAGLILLLWSLVRERRAFDRPTRREWRDCAIVGGTPARRRHGHGRVRRADHPVRDRRPDDRADARRGSRSSGGVLLRRAAARGWRWSGIAIGFVGVAVLAGPSASGGRVPSTRVGLAARCCSRRSAGRSGRCSPRTGRPCRASRCSATGAQMLSAGGPRRHGPSLTR